MSGFSPGSTPIIDPSGTFFGPKSSGPALIAGNILATFGALPNYVYSKDGTAWTPTVLPGGVNANGAAYGAGKWVMTTGSQAILTSTDGVTWVNRGNILPAAGNWIDVAWSPTLGLFVAVNDSNAAAQAATSPDGLVWTQRVTPAGVFPFFSLQWIPRFAKFYAFININTTTTGINSPDGINWVRADTIAATNSWYPRDFGAAFGLFGFKDNSVSWCRSTDGITFTGGLQAAANFPGDGNTTGAPIVVGGQVYSICGAGPRSLNHANSADLQAVWIQVNANILPALAGIPHVAVFSPALGLWILGAGGVNATQILTTFDAINYTLFNPTNAVAANLSRMMVAA